MFGLFLLVLAYFFLCWGFAVLAAESCWLCGARPFCDFGCLLCKRTGAKEETHDDDFDEMTPA